MGSGIWTTDAYDAAARYRAAHGLGAFDYTDSGADRVHPDLDPYLVGAREARDSAEHPCSTPIAVLFDVTGSMGHVPRVLQTKLPQLLGLLRRRGYVSDPQILFGGIGDATCDRAPLQIGQFESDNRMDDQLGLIYLEGGGGGQKTESYELAAYFMARHTALDSIEQRGKRGYLFFIGDEMPYPKVESRLVERVIGDRIESIRTEAIFAELCRSFDTYYVLPAGAAHAGDREVFERWRGLLGQNVIRLEDLDAVCEVIALTIATAEGADLATGLADLGDVGSKAGGVVSRALAPVLAARSVVATGGLPAGLTGGTDAVTRL